VCETLHFVMMFVVGQNSAAAGDINSVLLTNPSSCDGQNFFCICEATSKELEHREQSSTIYWKDGEASCAQTSIHCSCFWAVGCWYVCLSGEWELKLTLFIFFKIEQNGFCFNSIIKYCEKIKSKVNQNEKLECYELSDN